MRTPLKVTFDSNDWEHVVRLDNCQSDEKRRHASTVRQAIEDGIIAGYFSETWSTLQGLPKSARADFFGKQRIEPIRVEAVQEDGSVLPAVLAGPTEAHRPELPSIFQELA